MLPLRPHARSVATPGLLRVRLALGLVSRPAPATRGTAEPAVPAPALGTDTPSAIPTAGTLPTDALSGQLHALHDEYAELTNHALTEGREDLVQELADEYADRALRLITAGESFRTA